MRRTLFAIASLLACAGALPARAAPEQEIKLELRSLDRFRESDREFQLALSAQRRGDLDEAATRYRKAIRSDAAFVEAMVNLARVFAARGEMDQAAHWIDRALAQEPRYYRGWAARGLLSLSRGDLQAALDDLSRAAALEPQDLEVQVNLGTALLRRGLTAKARDSFARALRIDPDNTTALYDLALAEDLGGDAEEARLLYRRFLARADPRDPLRAAVQGRLEALAAAVIKPVAEAAQMHPAIGPKRAKPQPRRGASQ